MKKKLIIFLTIFLVIITLISIFIIKPKYELNKAVKYLNYGEYRQAYAYINSKNNEENKIIIKELISQIFCLYATRGMEQLSEIANLTTDFINDIALQNNNVTGEENINLKVNSLKSYIALSDKITKNMIIDELSEAYDIYFKSLKFVNQNFSNISTKIGNQTFISEIYNLSTDLYNASIIFTNMSDNYINNPKTLEIYQNNFYYLK